MIGYWLAKNGRNIPRAPQPIKRGIADSLSRLYTERNALRYDGTGHPIRFGDVIELTHPKPIDDRQAALFRFLIDRRHNRTDEIPEALSVLGADHALNRIPVQDRRERLSDAIELGWSWERLAGWLPGGMDASAWEAVIPNMGLMALTRNLRNFDGAGKQAAYEVTGRFCDPAEVRRSRQFPLRFLRA